MENKFCFLKGLVDCDSGRIQDCNIKRVTKCILEEEATGRGKSSARSGGTKASGQKKQEFCFLKGMVDCNHGRIQDCNIKRVRSCPLDK